MNAKIYRALLPFHVWTGLSVGLVLVMLALSGICILFRAQLEPIVAADLLRVDAQGEMLPLDRLVAAARQAHAGSDLNYVRLSGDPRRSALVRFKDFQNVYVDPYTAAILGNQNRSAGMFGRLVELHRLRYFGETGGKFTASCAMIFVAIIVTGLALWWPKSWGAFKSGLIFDRGLTGRRRLLSLHKAVGPCAAVIVLGSALTGAMQSFDWFKHALYPLTGSVPESAPAAPARVPGAASLELIRRQAIALAPAGFSEMVIYLRKGPLIDGYLVAANAPFPGAQSSFWIDAATGAKVKFVPYAEASAGTKLYQIGYAFHTGQLGGIFGQLVLLMGAASVPVLAVTGFLSYRKRMARSADAVRDSIISLT